MIEHDKIERELADGCFRVQTVCEWQHLANEAQYSLQWYSKFE